MTFLREIYARLLRVPVLGALAGKTVRGTKRLLGIPMFRSVDRIEMLQSALVGLKNENERLNSRVIALEKEQVRLQAFDNQLACIIEVIERDMQNIKKNEAAESTYTRKQQRVQKSMSVAK